MSLKGRETVLKENCHVSMASLPKLLQHTGRVGGILLVYQRSPWHHYSFIEVCKNRKINSLRYSRICICRGWSVDQITWSPSVLWHSYCCSSFPGFLNITLWPHLIISNSTYKTYINLKYTLTSVSTIAYFSIFMCTHNI